MLICFVFVFMALLEYALVNYTFFGKKARIAKKKLKESLRQKEREKAEQRKRTINLNSINQSKSSFLITVQSSQFLLQSDGNRPCNTLVELCTSTRGSKF